MAGSSKAVIRSLLLLCGLGCCGWALYASHSLPNQDIGEKLCIVADKAINEASGMARSLASPDAIWVHNDSGDTARLFLLGRDGETRAILTLNDTDATDWEDMCSFSLDGTNWLLIADIGDNGRVRTARKQPCRLLFVKEPEIEVRQDDSKPKVQKLRADVSVTIQIAYPSGPVDCESVAVDPVRREILFVTKTDPVHCRLLRTPLILEPGQHDVTLEDIGTPGVPFATAMDISSDGSRMLISSMFVGAVLAREPEESWQDVLTRGATVMQLPGRRQGETACFDEDPNFILVGSEGVKQPIWRVPIPR